MINVRSGLIVTDPYRVWRIVLPAPYQLWSANDTHSANRFKVSEMRKMWRTATYNAIVAHRLPQGLPRVSFDIAWHFTDLTRRDSLNYADTAKPIIDAFGPPFVQKPTKKKPAGAHAPGAAVIADDTDAYIDEISLRVGLLWQDVITADGYRIDLASVNALDREWGGVTIVVGELPPVDPTPKARKRTPLKDAVPADVRRRLALQGFCAGG